MAPVVLRQQEWACYLVDVIYLVVLFYAVCFCNKIKYEVGGIIPWLTTLFLPIFG